MIQNIEELISIKGIKAQGNRLSSNKIKNINLLDPIPYTPPEKTPVMELEVNDEVDVQNETVLNEENPINNKEGQTELEF